jgi:sphingomyelin phosphodiesterase acid-like 3
MRFPAFALALLFGCAWFFAGAGSAGAAPWLFVTDIHLKAKGSPVKDKRFLSNFGDDTSPALWASTIHEMKRVDPHPPVVVVNGDLLAHIISRAASTPVAVGIAHSLNRAFPQAQFVLALGNEDSACGDYALAPDAAFLRAVTAAWEPLVNRNGAAPDFRRTFARDGFYTARLPVAGLRAVVVDDVFWSPLYRAHCGTSDDVVTGSMAELERTLKADHGRMWVIFHIPPGVDAFSSAQLARRLAIVPFLRPDLRDRFVAALGRSAGHIALAVAGHSHKFAYRIVNADGAEPVPMLLVPAVSPIFGNAPSFLTANVDANGTLHDVKEHSFLNGAWGDIGGMPSLGVDAFTGTQLVALQHRLAGDLALRTTFERLYEGGAPPEINQRNWPVYWCAATAFTTAAFRSCTQYGGFSLITGRGLEVLLIPAVLIALAAAAFVLWRRRRRALRP